MKNTGLVLDGIVASSPLIGGPTNALPILRPNAIWTDLMPEFERQAKLGLETMNCVQFSFLNVLEATARFFGKTLNLSDRFLYWASGCTASGNTFGACYFGFKGRGTPAEQLWAWMVEMSREVYGMEPPEDIKREAMKIFEEWDLGMLRYVRSDIAEMKEALKKGPIWACNAFHAFVITEIDDKIRTFDTYPGNTGDGKGAFPLEYMPQIEAAYNVPFTPKELPPPTTPMPNLKLPENTLVTGVFANGLKTAIHINGKLMMDETGLEVLKAWFARNEKDGRFEGGPTRTISEKDWNSFPHVNFKGEVLP